MLVVTRKIREPIILDVPPGDGCRLELLPLRQDGRPRETEEGGGRAG